MNKENYKKEKFIFILEKKLKDNNKNKEKIKTTFLRNKNRNEIYREVKKTIDEIDLIEIEKILPLLEDEYQYSSSNIEEKYFNYIYGIEKNTFTKNKNAIFEYNAESLDVKLGSKSYKLPKKIEPIFNIITKNKTFMKKEIETFLNKKTADELLDFLVKENIIFHI